MVSPVRVVVSDDCAARLTVLGLTILERNLRTLRRFGFSPEVEATDTASHTAVGALPVVPGGVPVVFGDHQYSQGFFRGLADAPENAAPTSGVDVSASLKSVGEAETVRLLDNALFAEILAGTEGVIARLLNKKISFWLSRFLVRTEITPNAITVLNFIMGAIGCLLLLSLSWPWRALGAILIQFNSVCDGCDGEVARLKVVSSKLGAWLDTVSDDVLNNMMFVCAYLGVYRAWPNAAFLKICMATTQASLGVSFFIYSYLLANGLQNAAHFKLSWEKPSEGAPRKSWFDTVKIILKRDFFIFIAFILVILDLRLVLVALFVPLWGAFFLYLASFVHGAVGRVHAKSGGSYGADR